MAASRTPPSHILIVGTGTFALSTLSALLSRPLYGNSTFTLVSPSIQHPHTASVDTTRIIRADYGDPLYSSLGAQCQVLWRQSPWNTHYREAGLILSSKSSSKAGETDYVRKALHTTAQTVDPSALQVFESRAALSKAMRAGSAAKNSGEFGYINNKSGWGDAGGAVDALRARLSQDSRVTFIDATVSHLLLAPGQTSARPKPRVIGVYTSSHGQIHADLTLLATGAWTPSLVDMRGVGSCTAQAMAYVSLTDKEAACLARLPVCIDFNHGCFFFPPTARVDASGKTVWDIKVARHAHGYANPTEVDKRRVIGDALAAEPTAKYTPSLPVAPGTPIPARDAKELLAYLDKSLPMLKLAQTLRTRTVTTRLCHYLDTKTGDFIAAPHPDVDETSLFVLTGDSGHGFKFLPLLGEKMLDVIEARLQLADHGERNGEVAQWVDKWSWPARDAEDMVWCLDGSRSGRRGQVLDKALGRGAGVGALKL